MGRRGEKKEQRRMKGNREERDAEGGKRGGDGKEKIWREERGEWGLEEGRRKGKGESTGRTGVGMEGGEGKWEGEG